ncbi:MAG: hypothetical protein KF893_16530 [Caldilineaceae bacterium]|nr:hypothetical protein [Caldilineaceae bacterium]
MPEIKYPQYRSYVLRFWQESEESPWRGSVQSVEDGKTLAFGDLESLLIFLLNPDPFPLRPSSPPSADEAENGEGDPCRCTTGDRRWLQP